MEHDIHDFLQMAHREMQSQYLHIRKRARQDPGTAGDQGEEDWAALLREWLPSYFHVVTKGRILTEAGYASPQVDVLVLYPSYPRALIDKKLYLSGGVAAAFECKTTLEGAHIETAVSTCVDLKQALPRWSGSPYKELNAGIIYGLLAHSCRWTRPNSKPLEHITQLLWASDHALVQHPRDTIDFVCVADLAVWSAFKMTYRSPFAPLYGDQEKEQHGTRGYATTGYFRSAIGADRQTAYFTPIGCLVSGLFSRMAWEFPDMRRLEEYFRKANVSGAGESPARFWDISIYSEGIRDRIYRGLLSSGVPYDEWSMIF